MTGMGLHSIPEHSYSPEVISISNKVRASMWEQGETLLLLGDPVPIYLLHWTEEWNCALKPEMNVI